MLSPVACRAHDRNLGGHQCGQAATSGQPIRPRLSRCRRRGRASRRQATSHEGAPHPLLADAVCRGEVAEGLATGEAPGDGGEMLVNASASPVHERDGLVDREVPALDHAVSFPFEPTIAIVIRLWTGR